VLVGQARGHAAARGAVEKADLDEERLVDFFERVFFFGQVAASVPRPTGPPSYF
jgi:hypothetical protein